MEQMAESRILAGCTGTGGGSCITGRRGFVSRTMRASVSRSSGGSYSVTRAGQAAPALQNAVVAQMQDAAE